MKSQALPTAFRPSQASTTLSKSFQSCKIQWEPIDSEWHYRLHEGACQAVSIQQFEPHEQWFELDNHVV